MWRLGEFGRNLGEFPDYQTGGQSGLRNWKIFTSKTILIFISKCIWDQDFRKKMK